MKLSQKVIDEISDVYWEITWLKSLVDGLYLHTDSLRLYGDEDSLLYPYPHKLNERPSVPSIQTIILQFDVTMIATHMLRKSTSLKECLDRKFDKYGFVNQFPFYHCKGFTCVNFPVVFPNHNNGHLRVNFLILENDPFEQNKIGGDFFGTYHPYQKYYELYCDCWPSFKPHSDPGKRKTIKESWEPYMNSPKEMYKELERRFGKKINEFKKAYGEYLVEREEMYI